MTKFSLNSHVVACMRTQSRLPAYHELIRNDIKALTEY